MLNGVWISSFLTITFPGKKKAVLGYCDSIHNRFRNPIIRTGSNGGAFRAECCNTVLITPIFLLRIVLVYWRKKRLSNTVKFVGKINSWDVVSLTFSSCFRLLTFHFPFEEFVSGHVLPDLIESSSITLHCYYLPVLWMMKWLLVYQSTKVPEFIFEWKREEGVKMAEH